MPVFSRTATPNEVVSLNGMTSYCFHREPYEPYVVASRPGIVARLPGQVRRYAVVVNEMAISIDYDGTAYEYRDTWGGVGLDVADRVAPPTPQTSKPPALFSIGGFFVRSSPVHLRAGSTTNAQKHRAIGDRGDVDRELA